MGTVLDIAKSIALSGWREAGLRVCSPPEHPDLNHLGGEHF